MVVGGVEVRRWVVKKVYMLILTTSPLGKVQTAPQM
jgi:hypothetical protein